MGIDHGGAGKAIAEALFFRTSFGHEPTEEAGDNEW